MSHGQTETRWRSIVENINRVTVNFDRFRKSSHRRGQRVERVLVIALLRDFRKSEAGKSGAITR